MDKLYLDDFSAEESIDIDTYEDSPTIVNDIKPTVSLKSDINSKGEKIVVFSIKIPLKDDSLTIDIMINDDLYDNIGKHF